MLDASEQHKKVFPNKPLVSFRRAKNLKDNLVRAKLAPLQQEDQLKGCYQCGKSRCQVCEHMSKGDKFVCHVTGKEYRINSRFDCDSSGVVYLLSRKVCGMQYEAARLPPSLPVLTITSRAVGGLIRENLLIRQTFSGTFRR